MTKFKCDLERLAMAIYTHETSGESNPIPFSDSRCKQAYMEFAKAIIDNLEELDRCEICGDCHQPSEIPRECETGDGI